MTATVDELRRGLNRVISDAGDNLQELERDHLNLLDRIGRITQLVAQARETLEQEVEKCVAAADASWAMYDRASKLLMNRINTIRSPATTPPLYNMEKTVDVAQRLKDLTPDQWQRVIELARALGRRD
jgi:hypothetical protein